MRIDSLKARRTLPIVFLAALAIPAAVFADTAEQILDRIKQVNDTRQPKDVTQKGRMTIVDPGGSTRVRDLVMYQKNFGKRTSKSLIFFTGPADLKDVGVLAWIWPDKDDDQWIYFPATERVRRLSTELQNEGFGDSDFSNQDSKLLADMITDSTKVGTSKLAKEDDPLGGVPCVVIDFAPKQQDYAYSKLMMWLDRRGSTLRKMEFYAKEGGSLAKVMTMQKFETIDSIPTPVKIEMANVKRGSKTLMEFTETKYNEGLADDLFTQHQLQHGPR
jgi:outer membrane lipoprotein-sorting protein